MTDSTDTTFYEFVKYNDLGGTSLFGRCTWFEKHGKGKSREIPRDVVDKGCKFFEPKR